MSDLVFGGAPLAQPNLILGDDGTVVAAAPLEPGELRFYQAPATTSDLVFGELETGAESASGEVYPIALVAALPSMGASLRLAEVRFLALSAELPDMGASMRVVPSVYGQLLAKMPGFGASLRVLPSVHVQLLAQLPVMGVSPTSAVVYHTQTERPTVNQVATPAQVASNIEAGVQNTQQHAQSTVTGTQAGFSDAAAAGLITVMGFTDATRTHQVQASPFQEAARIPALHTQAPAQDGLSDRRFAVTGKFQEGERHQAPRISGRFQDGLHDRRPSTEARWQDAARRTRGLKGFGKYALPRHVRNGRKFQDAMRPAAGTSPDPNGPPPPVVIGPELLFEFLPGTLDLVFGGGGSNPGAPGEVSLVVVPIRRVYIVINNASLRRVDGNIYIPTFSMNLSLDVDSWTWGFSAALPAEALSSIEPASNGAPVEVEAMINGVAYRALVESVSRSRSFGKASISVQGRGKAALLDNPYAPVSNFTNSQERTAQQLMADVLTLNGVPMDWAVEWGLTDWAVPTGVFSHQGSYISALNAIAGAAGGYIQPHASAQTLRVLPRYPSTPWTWGERTPEFELPAAVTVNEGIAWFEKARYNRVYVSGVQQGVMGQVTRTGTAGDLLAPMVTDALITHADAARQRGLSVLANTGRQATVSLKLPVLAETGIITPGKFVRYVDGGTTRVGIVRSVGVDIGSPDIFQTLSIETHVN